MQLDKQTQDAIYRALMDAYPDPAELDVMLGIGLGTNINDIAGVSSIANRPMRIYRLIEWAASRDLVGDLVDAAIRFNDTNQMLQAVKARLAAQPVVGGAPAPPAGPAPSPMEPSAAQRLFDALVALDFKAQIRQVREASGTAAAAAFLVHGPTNAYGQRVLAWRLRNWATWKQALRASIEVGGADGVEQTPRGLWRKLAEYFQVPPGPGGAVDQAAVLQAVADVWAHKHVVIELHNVQELVEDADDCCLSRWIEEFWRQIVARAPAPPPPVPGVVPPRFWLVLILVDYRGRVPQSHVSLARARDDGQYPRIPLCLPEAGRFTQDVLQDWLDEPVTQAVLPGAPDAPGLLAASDNGVPQLLYDEVCRCLNRSFQGEIAAWLKS